MHRPARRRPEGSTVTVEWRNVAIWCAVLAAYGGLGIGLLVLAAHLHGPFRYVLGGFGVLGVGMVAVCVGAALLCVLGWGFFMGTFRRDPSVPQRSVWLLVAALFGAFLGSGTYAVGLIELVAGPLVACIFVAALNAYPFDMPYASQRITYFAWVAAAVSVPVGLTIFL